jgi:hypothetical protein
MRLPHAVCAIVLGATTVPMALLRLLVPAAAARAASTAAATVTRAAPPAPVESIKTRVRKRAARLAQR